jgi:hypothetical protein
MADQNALELLHGFTKSLKWFVCEKTARHIFMQLLAVYHAKKQHLEKIFTCRTMHPPSGSLCLTFPEMVALCSNNPPG